MDELKALLDSMIAGNAEQAQVFFHTYLSEKIKKMIANEAVRAMTFGDLPGKEHAGFREPQSQSERDATAKLIRKNRADKSKPVDTRNTPGHVRGFNRAGHAGGITKVVKV